MRSRSCHCADGAATKPGVAASSVSTNVAFPVLFTSPPAAAAKAQSLVPGELPPLRPREPDVVPLDVPDVPLVLP